ncbi:hypothetical protein AVEN_105515-1 [Araneus ventricosus]|uniref:Uncharacterized protein n=1 Tax=Araneus ventricosus TaxID=182803 RepID=A0A4Y2GJ74_ARAVE|nr:hypothetical protein AVEN_105515-1 [Araneus ventricosus]
MNALNIIDDDAYVIRGEQAKMQFSYSQTEGSIEDESFHVIVYKVFPTTRKETKTSTFIIPSGLHQQAKELFKEFKYSFAIDSRFASGITCSSKHYCYVWRETQRSVRLVGWGLMAQEPFLAKLRQSNS